MTEYSVGIAPQAERQIKKLPKIEARQVLRALAALKTNPRPRGAEKLNQNPKFWRIRVGDYRVVYAIEEKALAIVVAVVRHRKDAYRDLDKLKPDLIAKVLAPLLQGILSAEEASQVDHKEPL